MSELGLITLLLTCVGSIALLWAIWSTMSLPTDPESPVGPWKRTPPTPPKRPRLPTNFQTLINAQGQSWQTTQQWNWLCTQLSEIERALGGRPSGRPPPGYDPAWLNQRIHDLEQLAGPMPFADVQHLPPMKPPGLLARLLARLSGFKPAR